MTRLDATGEVSQYAGLRLCRARLFGEQLQTLATTLLLRHGADLKGQCAPMPSQNLLCMHQR